MKKLLLLLLLATSGIGYAQTYNNNWINYSRPYYKFNVGDTGLYRISQSVLAASGLSATPAEHFQLWRNGEQVRIYTSTASGPLGTGGFIEFWGLENDGKVDKRLYLDSAYQLSDQLSLQTDTAAYFLTVNSSSPNLRFNNAANNVSGTTLVAEPYFLNRVRVNYKNQINPGYARPVGGPYVYSSSYDIGEGWSSVDISPLGDLGYTITNLNLYTTGPAASFKIAASGNAINFRNIRVNFFSTTVVSSPVNQFDIVRLENNNIPLSVFQSPDVLNIAIQNGSGTATDRMVVSHFELRYPSKWNFNGQTSFSFELPASTTGNHLIIDNFNHGSQAPVLLDLNTGSRYLGDISTAGKVKFLLPASPDVLRKFVLTSVEGSAYKSVTSMVTRNFINYSLPANQSGYMIISNSSLFNNGSGTNFVESYRAYRASAVGGSYNAKIYNIDELVDQFGYGIKKHPIAVKDFIQFAKSTFSQRPSFVFIIGKGLAYNDYRINSGIAGSSAETLNLVPSFGYPASDNLLSSDYYKFMPEIPIGRLAVVNGNEVGIYLEKMKQFEQAQASPSQTVADKAWMKNVIHVIGGANTQESDLFKGYMNLYENMIEDTFYGAKVETFAKSSTAAVQIAANQRIEDLFREGLSMIGYFGHSSANTLEFNLSSPETYQNQGKYPFFNVSGCTAGNVFIYDPLRFTGNMTLSEKYVLVPQRGSIGFLASTNLGIPPYLHNYNLQLYKEISSNLYDRSIGEIIKKVVQDLAPLTSTEFFTRMHVEQILLHGDPALKVNPHPKPDYVIEEPMVKINPSIISVADNSFTVSVQMLNIGKAIKDSIRVTVRRTLPDNSTVSLYDKLIPAIRYMDSVTLTVPINPITDKGQNKIVVTLDVNNRVAESSETNNTVTKDFFIFEDEIRPVYPYNFSIITQPGNLFYGSTANPLTGLRSIVMEIDTTELFNSALKKTVNTASTGGLIQFNPGVSYTDNTVYYWRVAIVPTTGNYIWNNSSFVYLANGSKGFNQSHYYQHLKSSYNQISLLPNRKFVFNTVPRSLNIRTGLFPFYNYDVINVNIDFQQVELYGCEYNSLQFMVFDSATLTPWDNYNNTTNTFGRFGSRKVCDLPTRKFFEFPFSSPAYRKSAMDFLDSIPAGHYVSLTNIGNVSNTSFIDEWLTEQNTLGPGNSIYHKLKSVGFTQIDSFTRNRPFIFFFQKGVPSFTPRQKMGGAADEYLNESYALTTRFRDGEIFSPAFGPAKAWKELHWRGSDLEPAVPDSVSVEVYGINQSGNAVLLAKVRPAHDTTLNFIDPVAFPFVKLKIVNVDNVLATAHQLSYWRLNADYVPEGAVAPNITFKMKDTVEIGESIDFELAFKNISESAFDSLKVKFVITNQNNVDSPIIIPKQKKLLAGETLTVTYRLNTRSFPGNNRLFVDVNPDNDQPEQYHFNNFLFKSFFVRPDKVNPLLDVTFDGVHILNRDIVSAKPHIVIKLKDESRFLALNDTSLLKVQIRYPDPSGSGNGILRTYHFDQDTMKFTPATLGPGSDNSATIDLTPYLPGNDEEYELIVSGKDISGNTAGELEYKINFRVISKAMISNLLNYPNPFTSSTAFVFTITGSQAPQNMRIQILTVTGKVVREITRDELGPIHVGRNITDFKWDGTDQYGAKLANGVYLYRVITNLNGSSLEKYRSDGDNTDKFFNKGYGKMYLMR